MDESAAISILAQGNLFEPVTLLVGLKESELPHSLRNRLSTRVEELPLAYIHAVLSRAPDTKEIIAPLFTDGFDATELAYELFRAEYTGRFTILTPPLPQPDLVTREIQSICPDVVVSLVTLAAH